MFSLPILALDIAGRPFNWITPEQAATYYAKNAVAWQVGEPCIRFRGGIGNAGQRTVIDVSPVIAIARSDTMAAMAWQPLALSARDNRTLFRRDRYTCAYCGVILPARNLTRDHILARSRGGRDIWTNCVTACQSCNQTKAAKRVEEFRPLLYVPYIPCRFEHFLLHGRNVLADQHEYLMAKLPRHSRARH